VVYLLDTSIVIDVLNRKRGRPELVQQLLFGGGTLASCPITIAEVHAGMRPGEERRTERFLRSLTFFPITFEISSMAGDLIASWRLQGRTFALPDMAIAAVALSNDLVLVTGNIQDFPMAELKRLPA
jgi:predicted nucleic acid-binding protein